MKTKPTTQSVRLRAAIYRVWEWSKEKKEGMDQETYYQQRMDKIFRSVIQELEPPPIE